MARGDGWAGLRRRVGEVARYGGDVGRASDGGAQAGGEGGKGVEKIHTSPVDSETGESSLGLSTGRLVDE